MSAETPAPAFVAFDLETTGLSPKTDRLIEVGAVRLDLDLRPLDTLEVLADPGMPVPLAVQRLVGLTEADLRGAAGPLEAIAQLAEFCAGAVLVVHGGAMDLHVCRSLLPDQFDRPLVLDTLDLARILFPTFETHSLPQLAARLALPHDRPHRALSDATATAALLHRLRDEAERLPVATLAEARRVARGDAGPMLHFFTSVVRGEGGIARSRSSAGPASPRPAVPTAATPPPSRRSPAQGLEEAAVELLGPLGPLARDGAYEYREEQLQMARAVAQALDRRRRLLVEAGTGVGKSRAYLAPLLLWAQREGGRAVVATHTVNLQEQLMDSDVPALLATLADPPAVALLKGRQHYLSLRRWSRFLARPDSDRRSPDVDALRFKLKVLVWLAATSAGDRSELHLTGAEEQYWQWVASDSDDCLGTLCANWTGRRCHMVAARVAASNASVIITNHSLLLAASERQGQVLPEFGALVVDEAHHLEAAATEQLGVSVRAHDLTLVLERLQPRPGGAVAQAAEHCREAGHRLFGEVKGFIGQRMGGDHPGNARLALTAEVRDDPPFAPVLRAGRHAVVVLGAAADALEAARDGGAVQADLLSPEGGGEEELSLAASALRQLAAGIDRVVSQPSDEAVAWLELRAEQAELHSAPVSVAGPLRELLFERAETTVLTSATLSVGGSFGFVRSRVGIGDAAEELMLASPFDYLEQALCVLPGGVPPYDEPEHDAEIARLVGGIAERLDGHTLVLFTGYSPLRRVHAMLRHRLEQHGIALLGQGIDGTRRQILRSFLEDPRTVLLGTSSFWEGIDIPSERLRCVVIDKLPFPVPTDPLVRARTQGLSDAFGQYVLPSAVLRLRQGFGRLIRSRADRGAVVICDERLGSREYGEVFLRALPPAAVARAPVDEVPELVAGFVGWKNGASMGQLTDGA